MYMYSVIIVKLNIYTNYIWINAASQSFDLDSTIVPSGGYNGLMEWPYLQSVHLKSPKCSTTNPNECCEDLEGVQSKQRWAYVKVNMDGVVVGRKICLRDHTGYASLALLLEDMFGMLKTSQLLRTRKIKFIGVFGKWIFGYTNYYMRRSHRETRLIFGLNNPSLGPALKGSKRGLCPGPIKILEKWRFNS